MTSPSGGNHDNDDRLDAELRDHVERHVAHYVARGMTEADAGARVRLELGGLDQAKEAMPRCAAVPLGRGIPARRPRLASARSTANVSSPWR